MWPTSEQKISRTKLVIIILAIIIVAITISLLVLVRQREIGSPVTDREAQVQELLEAPLSSEEQLERQAQIAEILKQERAAKTKTVDETILWDVLQ